MDRTTRGIFEFYTLAVAIQAGIVFEYPRNIQIGGKLNRIFNHQNALTRTQKGIGRKGKMNTVSKSDPSDIERLTGADIQELNVFRIRMLSCLLYTSPSPRDATLSRMPSSA